MGMPFIVQFDHGCFYRCKECKTHIGKCDQVMSKNFTGFRGRAYLFNKTVNLVVGVPEEKTMQTGQYTAADVYCVHTQCNRRLGWTYIKAHSENQKFKEGKFVLERNMLESVHIPEAPPQ